MNAAQGKLANLFRVAIHADGYRPDSLEGLRVTLGRWLDDCKPADCKILGEDTDAIRAAILDAIVE